MPRITNIFCACGSRAIIVDGKPLRNAGLPICARCLAIEERLRRHDERRKKHWGGESVEPFRLAQ